MRPRLSQRWLPPHEANHFHRNQHRERGAVKRIGETHPEPEIDHRNRNHDADTDAETRRLPEGPGRKAAFRDRVEHREADGRDQGKKQQERPVELDELFGEPHFMAGEPAKIEHQPALDEFGLPDGVFACGRTGLRVSTSRMMSRATGAAAPEPDPPCSMTTERA